MSLLKQSIRSAMNIGILFKTYAALSYIWHKKTIEAAIARNDLRLNLGSGKTTIDGWLNLDMAVGARILTMKLPGGLKKFKANSVRYIYTSHFLEHIDYPDTALAIVKECHRILVPGGTLRIIVPGIEKIIKAYADNDNGFFAIQKEMHPSWCKSKLDHLMYALQQGGEHKYGYDFETMKALLTQAGFSKVIESDHNQSQEEALRIDYRTRVDNHGRYLSLYVDAIK